MPGEENDDYLTLAEAGHKTVMDLVAQANNSAVLSLCEEEALAGHQSQKWPASIFTLRALRTSATLMQFMTFEAVANFMAALAIAISNGKPGAPVAIRSLHPVEIDFLLEQDTTFNPKNGQITKRAGAFSASLDRLIMIPRLLGAVAGEECGIDKGGEGWQLIRRLTDLRGSLTHPRVIDQASKAAQPAMASSDVFQGARAALVP